MTRTLFIGLDGATFSILDPLMDEGVMPCLGRLAGRGVRGELRSTIPHVSPVAWTTLMTGRSPGNHGIFDFIRAEERGGEMYFTLYNARDVQCETIWSLASRQGLSVTLLNFMLTFPPEDLAGEVVPGLVSWKHLKRGVHPPELYEELKGIPGLNYREMAWDFELEKKVLRGIEQQEYEPWLQFHIRRERHWFEVARYLLRTRQSDLVAVVFDGIDKLLHLCWHLLDPSTLPGALSEEESKIRDLCVEYFRRLDGYIGELVELAGPEAQVFFASDHGFGPTKEVFRVNAWLHERGYLAWREPDGLDEAAQRSWERRLNSNFALLDWKRTKAYARTPSSNGIHIRRAVTPGDGGVPAGEYESFRRRLADELREVSDPAGGGRVVRDVWTREEAFAGSQMHLAPDLTVGLRDYGFMSIKDTSPPFETRREVLGTHHPDGVFFAVGPGVRRAASVEKFSIIDMAPIILHSLGLEIPEDFEGRVPAEIFEPSWREANPVRVGGASMEVEPVGAVAQQTPSDGDEAIFEQLKALGYIE